MKLIIQIPCYNEAATLPLTLADLPREVSGFDAVEWLVIDDGSTDGTARVARENGVDHVIRFPVNRGLARAFASGLQRGLELGADVVVNTDADNQYVAGEIPMLVRPVLEGRADLVIGERPLHTTRDLSRTRKLLQRLGSRVVRSASGTDVRDAPSGFRAMSRRALIELHVFNDYSYTLETIIQSGHKGLSVVSVPISTNPPTRRSRLYTSVPSYLWKQGLTIARIFTTYRPLRVFMTAGALAFGFGFLLGMRFLAHYLSGEGAGHVQSVILAAMLMIVGFVLGVTGVLADLISVNRKLLEEIDSLLKTHLLVSDETVARHADFVDGGEG
jgi:glycosyltransferase involved in cell wall biosynthesis